VPNSELPGYQAACDVLLMPYQARVAASSGGDISRYLSPMKLFEYLACGRVILSSDLPVFHEVLDSTNAILLPPEDHDTWVEAIQIGLQFPERYARLREQAQRDAQQYTWNARVQKIFKNL
jgi:glycosyltransferase involved in cell wall biosynthesis